MHACLNMVFVGCRKVCVFSVCLCVCICVCVCMCVCVCVWLCVCVQHEFKIILRGACNIFIYTLYMQYSFQVYMINHVLQ